MSIVVIILSLLTVYVLINVLAYRIQERFIFKPEKLPQDFVYNYSYPFEELFFDVQPGVRINGLKFSVENPRGLVLYFHGNSRSIKGWGKYSTDFTRHGFDVIMIDYRGFGKSTGKRSERNLKDDAQFVYEKLKEQYSEDQIIVYGRSIGSGFAAKVASVNFPKMLILDAPYYSLSRLTRRYLPILPIPWILRYPLRTNTWVRYVRCPIRIIHGTKDWLIPIQSSIDLANIHPQQTVLYRIEGGKHNDLPSFEEYHRILAQILDEAEKLPYERHHHRPELF